MQPTRVHAPACSRGRQSHQRGSDQKILSKTFVPCSFSILHHLKLGSLWKRNVPLGESQMPGYFLSGTHPFAPFAFFRYTKPLSSVCMCVCVCVCAWKRVSPRRAWRKERYQRASLIPLPFFSFHPTPATLLVCVCVCSCMAVVFCLPSDIMRRKEKKSILDSAFFLRSCCGLFWRQRKRDKERERDKKRENERPL